MSKKKIWFPKQKKKSKYKYREEERVKNKVEGKFIYFWTTIFFRDHDPIFHKSGFYLGEQNNRYSRGSAYSKFIDEIRLIRYEVKKKKEL